ncbi:MAG: glycosyltransferase family 4 protein [Moorea sp. SIO4A3]|nr:glycosyltransferase family 4 protein [Moorena sp. SIO4A3]
MKIAIITSGFLPVIDGVTVSGLSRLQRLSQWGHQVLLFCPDYSALEDVYPNWRDYTGQILPGVRIINLPSTSFMDLEFERQVRRSSYSILLQDLKKFQPDIIHVDEPERLFFGFFRVPGVAFAKKAGIPCVSFFRTNFLDYAEDYFSLPSLVVAGIKFIFKTILLSVYNSYDVTLVSSRITHKKIIDLGIKNTLYANLLGFDASKFSADLQEEQFFEKNYDLRGVDSKVKLVFLGRLTPDKGWEFTLNAFSRVVQKVNSDQIALIIVGDGPMRDEIATRLSKLTPNSYFLGRVPPENVPALLVNSDIHITASEKETRGLTILEAFAAGIPVLAPEAGGVVENIQDGLNGFLFTPQNQEDFSDKLKVLIENPTLRQEMGRNGRECVSQYGWDERVQNLIGIWENQIAKKTH